MIARLREIADRPLGSGVASGVVVLAGAACVGFAVLVGLGLLGPGGTGAVRSGSVRSAEVEIPAEVRRPAPIEGSATSSEGTRHSHPTQDPQDRSGSPAARRAHHELSTHRALQALPWHREGVSIELIGAEDGKAVLEVLAPTVAEARGVYRRFLRRRHDDGGAYRPRFRGLARGVDRDLDRGLIPGSARDRAIPHGTADPGAPDLPRSLHHKKEEH